MEAFQDSMSDLVQIPEISAQLSAIASISGECTLILAILLRQAHERDWKVIVDKMESLIHTFDSIKQSLSLVSKEMQPAHAQAIFRMRVLLEKTVPISNLRRYLTIFRQG